MISVRFSDAKVVMCQSLKDAKDEIHEAHASGVLPEYIVDTETGDVYGCSWFTDLDVIDHDPSAIEHPDEADDSVGTLGWIIDGATFCLDCTRAPVKTAMPIEKNADQGLWTHTCSDCGERFPEVDENLDFGEKLCSLFAHGLEDSEIVDHLGIDKSDEAECLVGRIRVLERECGKLETELERALKPIGYVVNGSSRCPSCTGHHPLHLLDPIYMQRGVIKIFCVLCHKKL